MTFEEAFSEFIDRREYDEAAGTLFKIVRIAFEAGWKAAGGEALCSQNIIELAGNTDEKQAPP